MKRSVLGLSASLVLGVTGCGMFDSESAEAPLPDKPRTIEGAPAIDVRDDAGFFVAPAGDDAADGSREKPFATLARTIYEAKMKQRNVFACAGTFEEEVVLVEGVSMLGGLDCSRPDWPISDKLTRIASPRSPAMQASWLALPIRVEGFEVVAPDGKSSSESSIALQVHGAPSLTIVRSKLIAGNAANGADGTEPPSTMVDGAVDGEDGALPKDMCPPYLASCSPQLPKGAAGGDVTCNGKAYTSIRGGNGGSPGIFQATMNGDPSGRLNLHPLGYDAANDSKPGEIRYAQPGVAGRDGKSAAGFGAFTPSGYTPKDGQPGTDGANGKGGDGGKGSWPTSPWVTRETVYRGFGGAGGGAGGCGGIAGTPGSGGGASIAVLAVNSPIQLVGVEIVTGNGGPGGRGSFGAAPTRGGSPGKASPFNAGTAGGNGGRAGTSGSGAGGPSVGIAYSGTTPAMTDVTFIIGNGGAGVPALTQPDGVGGTSRIEKSGDGPRAETIGF